VNTGSYAAARTSVSGLQTVLVVCFFLSVVLNAVHHYMLRLLKLEMDKTRTRTFPSGLLFDYVACPHYTFEVRSFEIENIILFTTIKLKVLTWWFFAVVSNTLASWGFFFATLWLLLRWSKERHVNYQVVWFVRMFCFLFLCCSLRKWEDIRLIEQR
jgi:hypothetical protein